VHSPSAITASEDMGVQNTMSDTGKWKNCVAC